MRGTWALVVLLAVVLAGAPALGAPTTPPAAITGFPPYVLGRNIQTVLSADLELCSGDYPLWTNNLLTRNYGRSIVASIGGVNYVAMLGLQFWHGRLAAVILKWPARAFPSPSAWRHAAKDLRKRITTAYAPAAVTEHIELSDSTWTIELVDGAGNNFSAWSIERPYEITMVYLWAPYAEALESPPAPEGNY